jgi:hypothetical protein
MAVMRDVLEAIHERRCSANPGSDLFAVITSYQLTPAEQAAGVTPTDFSYPPGCPDRFGFNAVPGTTDMTTAVQAAINSCDRYIGTPGSIYAVTSVIFNSVGLHYINFNGSTLRGIATSQTTCIAQYKGNSANVYAWNIDGNFNQHYKCGTWWYDAASSSQYNNFFGVKHTYLAGVELTSGTTIRAMIYGEQVGSSSTSFAQSENQVFGWRTRGCSNPFYGNHNNGVLQFTDGIFVVVAEEWPNPAVTFTASVGGATTGTLTAAIVNGQYAFNFGDGEFRTVTVTGGTTCNWTGALTAGAITTANYSAFNYINGRCFEDVKGIYNRKGGELQFGSAGVTVAAELLNTFLSDVIIETSGPIRVNGDGVRISGGRFLQDQLQPCINIGSGATGVLAISDMYFNRTAGVGAFDNNALIDASGVVGAFEIILADTESFEYRWTCVGADVRLVKPSSTTTVRYKNHRMNMTAADTNVYILNTGPTDSILDITAFDRLGYTTNGWNLFQDFGGGTTLTVTTAAGPTGYLASQIQLLAPAGQQAIGTYGNPNAVTLTNLKTSAVFVHPGDLYWVGAWCNEITGTGGKLSARFFTLAGAIVSDVPIADSGSIPSASWKYVEGPLVVPATSAYMCLGLFANNGTIALTDLRLRRAGL